MVFSPWIWWLLAGLWDAKNAVKHPSMHVNTPHVFLRLKKVIRRYLKHLRQRINNPFKVLHLPIH